MKILPSLGLTACALTAACGDAAVDAPSYIELQQEYTDLTTSLNALPDAVDLAGSALPDSGDAKYEGVMAFTAGPTLTVAGTMTLDADFGAGRISGSATNFRDENDIALNGTLNILENDVNVANPNAALPTFVPFVSGTLMNDTTTAAVLGTMTGDFFGTEDNPAFLAGSISGTVNVNDSLEDITASVFIAERTDLY